MGLIASKFKRLFGTKERMKFIFTGYYEKSSVNDNLVLFESFHGKNISDSPLYILKALLEMPQCEGKDIYFATNDEERDREFLDAAGLPVKLVHIHSDKYPRILATAGFLVNNSSFPSYYIRRKEQKYLQTWHGTPLKTLGREMPHGMESMYNVQHNFLQATHLMFPNKFTRDVIMRDYNLKDLYTGKVLLSGYPRNSIFCDEAKADELKKQMGNEKFTTMAYMPTWRGQNNRDVVIDSYNEEVNNLLGALDEFMNDNQKLYVNFHPIIQDQISLNSYKHILPFPKDIDKYEFLNSVDALITDYSSVFFDYSVTSKPIILYMYDYEEYMKDRGMYFDIRELPFRKIYELEELKKCIVREEFRSDDYSDAEDYFQRFIKYESIDAGRNMAEAFFADNYDRVEVEDFAFNLGRKLKVRDCMEVSNKSELNRMASFVDRDKEVVMFHYAKFSPELSHYFYENYKDAFRYIFVTKAVPRKYSEEMLKPFSAAIRDRIYSRDMRRCFGDVYNDEWELSNDAEVTALKTSGTVASVRARLSKYAGEIKDVRLIARSDFDVTSYPFRYTVRDDGDVWNIQAEIDMAGCIMEEIFWDVRLIVNDGGKEKEIPCRLNTKLKRMMKIRNYQCVLGDCVVFPHVTLGNNLAFTQREKSPYDGSGIRVKELFAYAVYRVLNGYFKKKHIWLVFEKFCSMAQDNGYYFFKYCMDQLTTEEKKRIFYVMDKDAEDMDKLKQYGSQVILFMSFRHLLYNLTASIYVGSDSKKHLYIWRPKPNCISSVMKKKDIFFLQHGVTALKKVDPIFGVHGSSPMTYFTTTSEYEQKIVVDNFGYPKENVPVVGFTRWDVLEDKSRPDEKIILVMPTWRSWLEERTVEEFKRSDYYERYMKLLSNDELKTHLAECGVKLIFYIHPKFKDYMEEFAVENENIEMIPFGSEPLNDIMMRCSLLITDYSSVCWDVYYMGKPVLFYQFDYDMYMEIHGSYMDMKKELFGERFEDGDELVEAIRRYVDSGFEEPEEAAAKRDYYFSYIDSDNSRRTHDYIASKGY